MIELRNDLEIVVADKTRVDACGVQNERIVTCACQQRNNLGIFARHDTSIFPASVPIVCDHDFPQRALAVLDSTHNGEDALASTRRNAGGVEHLHVVFPNTAVVGIFVRAGYDFVVSSAQASSSAQRSPAAVDSLLAA